MLMICCLHKGMCHRMQLALLTGQTLDSAMDQQGRSLT